MNLKELGRPVTSTTLAESFETQFGQKVDVSNASYENAVKSLQQVRAKIVEFKQSKLSHTRETNPTYLKLMMMEQALEARVNETEENTMNIKNITQDKKSAFVNAIKEAAKGGKVDPSALRSMGISESLVNVLESQESAVNFMKSIVEKRKCKENTTRLQEGEVDTAQVVLAAQDMVDQVQKMIENMSDLRVKELPALADGIRGQMGAEQATAFTSQAGASLDALIQSLTAAKEELNAATGILTGEQLDVPGEGGDMPMGGELEPEMPAEPMGEPEMDASLDAELDALDEPEGDLGRDRV